MQKERTSWALAALCASAAALAACGHTSTAAAPAPRAPRVAVATVQSEQVTLTTELPGRTSPYLVAEIRPQVNGIIQQRAFREGADVQAGQLLYQIDPDPYRAILHQAEAALAATEAALPALRSRAERVAGLAEFRAAGRQDADDARSALLQAEATIEANRAAVESARINLSYTPIRAPIPGRTGKSMITVGALVAAYQPVPLVVIQQLDPIYVDVTQSSAEVLRLRRALDQGLVSRAGKQSRKVRLLLEDGTPYPIEGTLQFQDVTVDPMTGSIILRLVFRNPHHVLLPGMYVRAVVEEGVAERALLVPQQGVTRNRRGDAVAMIVTREGKVEERQLAVGRAVGDRWLVTAGLAPGDRVVVEGKQQIRPGMHVDAVPFDPAPPTAASAQSAATPAAQ